MPAASPPSSPTVAQSLREYGRGVLGGLIVSLPLLYTMEVWWAGLVLSPTRLLAGLGGTFALLLLYNRYAGLRPSSSWAEIATDSVEELGIGLVVSALVLWLTGTVGPDTPTVEVAGKVVVEACLVAIGVSVGTAQLGDAAPDDVGMTAEAEGTGRRRSPLAADLALALCGAVLIGANVAPTDEVMDIAGRVSLAQLGGFVAVGWALSVGAVVADADGRGPGAALREGTTCYAVALVASAALLAFFGRLDDVPLLHAAAPVVVLGLPTAIGAGAGRLIVEGTRPDERPGETGATPSPARTADRPS